MYRPTLTRRPVTTTLSFKSETSFREIKRRNGRYVKEPRPSLYISVLLGKAQVAGACLCLEEEISECVYAAKEIVSKLNRHGIHQELSEVVEFITLNFRAFKEKHDK